MAIKYPVDYDNFENYSQSNPPTVSDIDRMADVIDALEHFIGVRPGDWLVDDSVVGQISQLGSDVEMIKDHLGL